MVSDSFNPAKYINLARYPVRLKLVSANYQIEKGRIEAKHYSKWKRPPRKSYAFVRTPCEYIFAIELIFGQRKNIYLFITIFFCLRKGFMYYLLV